jgi:hypothetical protein
MTHTGLFVDPDDLHIPLPWDDTLPNTLKRSFSELRGFDSSPGGLTKIEFLRASSDQPGTCLVTSIEIKTTSSGFVHPKMNDHVLNESPTNHTDGHDYGENYKQWRKLTLVAKSIHRFRSLRVERIKTEINLRINISNTPSSKRNTSTSKDLMYITPQERYNDALSEFRDQTAFFEALQIASKKDLVNIRATLMKDPKENYYDAESPHRLANKPNYKGYTPLYIACKNGHLELVRLLIEFKANPYQLCIFLLRKKSPY